MVGNVKPKKFLGQHFLIDENISKKIIESIDFSKHNKVIEVGPGKGALTKHLLKIKDILTLVEIDKECIFFLKNEFINENLEIIEKDFLNFKIAETYPSLRRILIIGNFPYNISSQIVFKIIENKNLVETLVGMFQLEVAKRICEKPGSKSYGILSVLVQAFYETNFEFSLEPTNFTPPPKVNSGVITLKRNKELKLKCNEALFFKVVKTSFQQRRKTIRNSLKIFNLSNNIKEDAIFGKRPEMLSVDDFVHLTNIISNENIST